jgi:hypothetical protein
MDVFNRIHSRLIKEAKPEKPIDVKVIKAKMAKLLGEDDAERWLGTRADDIYSEQITPIFVEFILQEFPELEPIIDEVSERNDLIELMDMVELDFLKSRSPKITDIKTRE